MDVVILRNLLQDEGAQDLIEYALVAALLALGAVAAMDRLATVVSTTFNNVASEVTSTVRPRH